jgi:hypothetical protein
MIVASPKRSLAMSKRVGLPAPVVGIEPQFDIANHIHGVS